MSDQATETDPLPALLQQTRRAVDIALDAPLGSAERVGIEAEDRAAAELWAVLCDLMEPVVRALESAVPKRPLTKEHDDRMLARALNADSDFLYNTPLQVSDFGGDKEYLWCWEWAPAPSAAKLPDALRQAISWLTRVAEHAEKQCALTTLAHARADRLRTLAAELRAELATERAASSAERAA